MAKQTRADVDALLATGMLTIEWRVLRRTITYPGYDGSGNLIVPPWSGANYPTWNQSIDVTPYVESWQLDDADDLAGATLRLQMSDDYNTLLADNSAKFSMMDVVEVKEYYHSGVSDTMPPDTDFSTIFIGFVSGFSMGRAIKGEAPYEVQAMDFMKLLMMENYDGVLGGIRASENPNSTSTNNDRLTITGPANGYYTIRHLKDATNGYYTDTWASDPVPYFEKSTDSGSTYKRLTSTDDTVQIAYGDGYVYVEESYFKDSPNESAGNFSWGYDTTNPAFRLRMTYERFKKAGASASGLYSDNTFDNELRNNILTLLLNAGFQKDDSAKPFYLYHSSFPTATDLGVTKDFSGNTSNILIPEIVVHNYDDKTHFDVLRELMDVAPPNYQIWIDPSGGGTGSIVGQLRGQAIISPAAEDYTFGNISSIKTALIQDDGIFTKVIAVGQRKQRLNHASKQAGGSLTTTVLPTQSSGLSAAQYLASISQVNDGNFMTPNDPDFGCRLWNTNQTPSNTGDSLNNYIIFGMRLGSLETDNAIEIEEMVFAIGEVMPGKFSGMFTRPQKLEVWYHPTDYAAYSTVPPTGGVTTANLTANGWKLLAGNVMMPQTSDVIRLSSSQLARRRPRARYLLVVCAQTAYVHRTQGKGQDDCFFALSEVGVFGSDLLYGTATLGVTTNFNDSTSKALMQQLRPRTYVTDLNPEASNQTDVNNFAQLWLRELVRDFTPREIDGVRPDLRVRDAVKSLYTNKIYLVRQISRNSNGDSTATLVFFSPAIADFSTF